MPTKPNRDGSHLEWVLFHLETAVCHALEAKDPPNWLDTALLPLVTQVQQTVKKGDPMHPKNLNRLMPPSQQPWPPVASTFFSDWDRHEKHLQNRSIAYDWCHPPDNWTEGNKQAYYNVKRQHQPIRTYTPPPIAG